MNFGRTPPPMPGMGSLWTKIRDASNPVKQIKKGTEIKKELVEKLNIKPLEKVTASQVKIATKVDDEVSRAGKNPHLIKIVAVIVAAVLVYFGQANLALAVLEAGQKHAEGVKAKKALNASIAEQQKEDAAANTINELIGFMKDTDQVIVINAYNAEGYKALSRPEIIKLLDAAKVLRDADFFYNAKNRLREDTPTERLRNYICRAISYTTNMPIKDAGVRSNVVGAVLANITKEFGLVTAAGQKLVLDAVNTEGADAFKRADFNAIVMPIVKSCVALIKERVIQEDARQAKLNPATTVKTTAPVNQPPTAVLPAPTTTAAAATTDFKKFIPLGLIIGFLLK